MNKEKTPEHIYERALLAKEQADKIIAQSKSLVPELYHQFIVLLNETKRLSDECVYIDDRTFKLGVWHKEGMGTLQTLPKPYMNVNGRIRWARDEHKEAGMKLIFHPPVISDDQRYMSLKIESEMLGEANVITEITFDERNSYNQDPVTFAHTKAKGKALGDLGYGLIGDGVSSAEEVQEIVEEPSDVTYSQNNDNEPKEITVIAVSEPEINEEKGCAVFKGVAEMDDYKVIIPLSKKKEIQLIKRGVNVSGHAWFDGAKIRFSADNAIHVVKGVRRIELTLETSPTLTEDGNYTFHAMNDDKKFRVKAPVSLQEELKYLMKGQKVKVDGLFIKGIISLPKENKIEVLTKKAG